MGIFDYKCKVRDLLCRLGMTAADASQLIESNREFVHGCFDTRDDVQTVTSMLYEQS